jgi:ketosteroid isomerase-like protein
MPTRFQDRPTLSTASVHILLLACLIVFCTPHAYGLLPHHDSRALHKQIEALEMEWRQAQLDNNTSIIDHLLADDYVGISANGTIETKAQVLAMRRAGTMRFTQLDLTDVKVRLFGDTAVVTSRADLQGTNGERDISGQYRYTRVYNRRLGQWKIVSFEASRIHDTTERATIKH